MQELIGEGLEEAQERRYSKLHDSDRGDSKKMSKGNATIRMHQEKRCCMMMSQGICEGY